MALVAMVAVLMGSGIMVNRLVNLHRNYQERATDHGGQEQLARFLLSQMAEVNDVYKGARAEIDVPKLDPESEKSLKELMKTDPDVKRVASDMVQQAKLEEEMMRPVEEFMKVARSEIDYHSRLKAKYTRAAAHPWLSVLPDTENPGVNLMEMWDKAMEKMDSKYAEIESLPLPPRLQIVEPEPPGGK